MANVKELEAQLLELRQVMAAHGIVPTKAKAEGPRPDRVEFGSPEHAAILGLVLVDEGTDASDYVTYTSPSGKVFRLADEYEPVRHFPAMDPAKSARVILRQRVGELEGGEPPVSDSAPSMWRPAGMPG